MIETGDLRKKYGWVNAVDGMNLHVGEGEFLTIFGPNGAGKTTLIRLLSSMIRPTSGRIRINGQDIREAGGDFRRLIGVISHHTFLYDHLTARENLRFYSRLYGLKNPEEKIDRMLEEVDLVGWRNERVGSFSRGMQQRLSIARALLHSPRVMLLDEPYTGLDQHAARNLREMLRRFMDGRRTIILTTHNLSRGLELCTRVAVQVRGRLVYESAKREMDPAAFESLYFSLVERSGS